MAQAIIYPQGVAEITVPASQSIAISNFGGGIARIYYLINAVAFPPAFQFQQTLEDSSVTLGAFSSETIVKIEAGNSKVVYDVGSSPDTGIGDADTLNGQAGSYYQNADNMNAGTLSDDRLPDTISSDITGNAATVDGIEGSNIAKLDSENMFVGPIGYFSDSALRTDPFQHYLATIEYVYSQDNAEIKNGYLTHIDSDDQGDNLRSVWGDRKFIYAAYRDGGLHTYSVDASGNLTHIDSDDQGGLALGVWGDGRFIYLANSTGGLLTYSVSDTGILTFIDSDYQGDTALGVWGDGRFIYLANYTGGLLTYSVDDSGMLTFIDSDDPGDGARSVWGDGRFIYVANATGGLHTYSVSDAGILTHIDSDDQGDEAYGVWSDGKFIYLANDSGGLHTYSVSDTGILTHIDSDDQGDRALGVWGDGRFIYLANYTGGLLTYSVDAAGQLTFIDSDDQGDNAYGVWGDGKFIFLANDTGGLHTYSINNAYAYSKSTETHSFVGDVAITGAVSAGNGVSGTIDTTAAQTITVVDGIITAIA
jgi:hypothetical protein